MDMLYENLQLDSTPRHGLLVVLELRVLILQHTTAYLISNETINKLYPVKTALHKASKLKISDRVDLEIANLINSYFLDSKGILIFKFGLSWLDAGTFNSLMLYNFVQVINYQRFV